MSLTDTTNLPAQPAAGFYLPNKLGGDGETSPANEYIAAQSKIGDASGGALTIVMNLDVTYAWLITSVGVRIDGIAADQEVVIRIAQGTMRPGVSGMSDILQIAGNARYVDFMGGNDNFFLWTPPPFFIDPPDRSIADPTVLDMQVQTVITNPTAAGTMQVKIRMLQFNKGAKFRQPLELLVASLSRGTSQSLN